MMREVLFRGKTVFDNTWIVGSLVINKVDTPKEFREVYRICDNTYGFADEDGFEPDFMVGYDEEVDPSTVGQYTGLTANGKRIFEGDVIKFHKHRGEPDWIGVVKYEHCLYMVAGTMPFAYEKRIGEDPYFCPFEVQISGIDKATIEVIGNIHDNPDLLEVDHE